MSGLDRAWLTLGALRLRRTRGAAAFLTAVAAAGLAAAIAVRAGAGALGVAAAALLGGLAAGAAARRLTGRSPLTPELLAGYVNRTVPEAEESAQLLLQEAEGLTLLERLQQRRTETALAGRARLPDLPTGPQRPFLRAALALALAALAVVLIPAPSLGGAPRSGAPPAAPAPAASGAGSAPSIASVRLVIRPPAYTGRPLRRISSWDALVEEGTELTWHLTVAGVTRGGRVVTAAGDTVALSRSGSAGYDARLLARRSTLYRVLLDHEGGPPVASDDHRLSVRPDLAPVLAMVRPGQRTAVRPGDPMRLPVQVLATDDYGVDAATIVATVTKGQGEGVKFREQRLLFESRAPEGKSGVMLRRVLDLSGLGLEPGDELYFHVLATDHRTPVPNETRSETVFITMVDTSRASIALGTGLALNLPPDFFRSQRQLIIDTEKLLQDRASMPASVFRDRSNGLGIDQGLLRLRYGQFMGDEFETAPMSGREAHAQDPEPEPPREPGDPEPDPMAEFRHDHDNPENATLLAPQIKAKLREAITQMWSSELHLRMTDPKTSLPFQYRALALLQEVRQNARSYVKRVGFDPPPLEPDRKRLTGDLTNIGTPVRALLARETPTEPGIRAGIGVLQRLRWGSAARPGDREALEAAGTELARLAVDDPVHLLEPLRALRSVIAVIDNPARRCDECFATAERGLWRALPSAAPRAGPGPSRTGILSREYHRLLGRRE